MQLLKSLKIIACASVAALIGVNSASAADWPMWRFESNRSAISPEVLPDSLNLQWIRTYNPPKTAWDNQGEQDAYGSTTDSITPQTGKLSNDKKYLSFDIAYQPIVVGTTMLFGSPNNDRFNAVDVTTGAEKWHFFANAPIRFAPVAKNGKVYFGSDDGYLYCLNVTDGSLVWKFNATPNSRKVMGNDRLTSVWPVRGAPVIPNSSAIAPTQAYLDWNASHNKRYIIANASDDKQEQPSGTVSEGASGGININQLGAFRFSHSNYKLNQGATIDSAFIQFTVSDTNGGTAPCTLSVYAAAVDSSVALGSSANALSSIAKTTASVDWVVPKWDTLGAQKAKQRTPNLKPLLQELVNRTGWNPKSPVTLLVTVKSGNGWRTVYSMDQSSSKAAYLTIYSSGLVVDSTTQPTPTVTQTNADTNTVYFSAGLYPYEGVFVYALDATTGNLKWINDGNSMQYSVTPHGTSESFTGLAPQGYFCTGINNSLIVPNGRAYPACLDRSTGKLNFFNVSSGNGYHVVSQLDQIYVGSSAFSINNFASSGSTPAFFNGNNIQIQAGSKIYSAGALNDIGPGAPVDSSTYTVSCGSWSRTIIGRPAGLLAANGRLFVTTTTGKIYCFGSTVVANPPVLSNSTVTTQSDANTAAAADIITRSGYTQGSRGIAIVIGLSNGRICEELAKQSDLTIIGIDPDAAKVNAIRERLDSTGLYGYKVHLIAGDIRTAGLPQYIAQIITTESVDAGFADLGISPYDYIEALYRSIRPYGGVACLPISETVIQRAVTTRNLKGTSVSTSGTYTLLTKAGRVPGSADFNSQYCDAAHTNYIKDSLAKAPVGCLWFGGSDDNTNDKLNSRHGHGPTEQVVGGRYYIQGPNTLRCVDLYTGRKLWDNNILRFGEWSDYTEHEGGTANLGDNYVSLEDAIYALGEHDMNKPPKKCYVFDPKTGATKQTITLPDSLGAWGFISVCDSFIVATTQPMAFDSAKLGNGFVYWYSTNTSLVGTGGNATLNGTTSSRIVVLNRYTGNVVWNYKAEYGIYNLTVVAGNNKVFAIDKLPATSIGLLKRAGIAAASVPKVKAFDLHTGALLWTDSSSAVFGRYLAYSKDHNVLIEASKKSSDVMVGEPAPKQMVARNGSTGAILWQRATIDSSTSYYGGPVILADTEIITQDGNNIGMINLNTGKWQTVDFGMTGKKDNFYAYRHYGCNFDLGALNMITFRSGAPSYYDLNLKDGVANIAGSKSGCTNSVVPADAVVLAADYTRTCSCMYSIQTAAAMVYDPDVERWTCNDGLTTKIKNQGWKLQNIGINLGAPGDRRDDNGTMWTEYPTGEDKVGFPAYPLPITVSVTGDSATYFRHHASRASGDGLKWVASSGVEGASKVTLTMAKDSIDGSGNVIPHTTTNDLYNVTVYFMEPNVNAKVGDRVFDVSVNGTVAASNLDIVQAAGGAMKIYTKVINDVTVGDKLEVALTAKTGKPVLSGFSAVKKGIIPVAVKSTTKSMLNAGLKYYDGSESLGNASIDAVDGGVKAGIKAGLKK